MLNGESQLSALDAQIEVLAATSGSNLLGSNHFNLVTEKSDIQGELVLEEDWV